MKLAADKAYEYLVEDPSVRLTIFDEKFWEVLLMIPGEGYTLSILGAELVKKKLDLFNSIHKQEEELKSVIEKIIEIEKEEKEVKELFKGVPNRIIDDFKAFPNMTDEILEQRIRDIYSDEFPDMNYKLIWEAFRSYFKKRDEANAVNK
jgi:predicted nuclease with TOPRIM domain